MYKIDRNVPIPGKNNLNGLRKYPFSTMNKGESVFIAGKTLTNIAGCYSFLKKAKGMKFTARTLTEGGKRGLRVWRVE